MSRKLFVNIAVQDLTRSVDFFTKLGFAFDPRFSDDSGTAMIVSDDAMFMLLDRQRFAGFATKPVSDPATQTEAFYAFQVGSREEVDELAEAALGNGGAPAGDVQDHGFMYGRSFADPDGHHWEVFWMDASAMPA